MKCRIPKCLAIWLPLLILIGIALLFQSPEEEPSGVSKGSSDIAGQATESAELSFAEGSSAPARFSQDPQLQALLRDQMEDFIKDDASGRPAKMIPITEAPPELIPKQAPLSQTQRESLTRLEWSVPGKHIEYRTGESRSTISFLKGRRMEPRAEAAMAGQTVAETTVRNFLRKNASLFAIEKPDDELVLEGKNEDNIGYTQLRFSQRYQNLEVVPSSMLVQLDEAGNVDLMTGSYAPTPRDEDPVPSITAEMAIQAAMDSLPEEGSKLLSQRLVYYAPREQSTSLAYEMEFHHSDSSHLKMYVSASDASLLGRASVVCAGHVVGNGIDLSGETQTLNLWEHTDNRYYMVNTTKAMYDPTSTPPRKENTRGAIIVLDADGAGSNAVLTTPRNVYSSNAPDAGFPSNAVSIATMLDTVYDFFLDEFGRNSFDGAGGSINAYGNIPFNNAMFIPGPNVLLFGNQDNWDNTLDFAAHEFAHGVVSTTASLIYQNQSGAMNESFADIFGEGCEGYALGGDPDWKLGTDLVRPLRAMDDPSTFIISGDRPYPKTMSDFIAPDDPFLNGFNDRDFGGVHFNSSIINHCFYLLASGMDEAIGRADALQVFYRALTTKLNQNSGFLDCRLACIQSASELFGASSPQRQATSLAFDRVEIFDSVTAPPTTELEPVEGADSVLFLFRSDGLTYVGRREEAFGDGLAGVFLGNDGVRTVALPGKRPSVLGDGTRAFFVTPDFDAATINTMTGEVSALGFAGTVESTVVAPGGEAYAVLFRQPNGDPDNRILIFDFEGGESKTYELGHPSFDGLGLDTNVIEFADSMAFSKDGRYLFYDAQLSVPLFTGGSSKIWMVYYIDRENDRIGSLFQPDPFVSIGNMALGQINPGAIAFDILRPNGVSEIWIGDLLRGQYRFIRTLGDGFSSGLGWPSFSGDDTAVVYSNHFLDPATAQRITYLESQPLESDVFTPRGQPFNWLSGSGDSGPETATIYRRGASSSLPSLSARAGFGSAREDSSEHASIVVTRDGSLSSSLSFDYTIAGTARNGIDYAALPMRGEFSAGDSEAEIVFEGVEDGLVEGPETVTLSLADSLSYRISSERSATVTIEDSDTQVGEGTFASWAGERSIGADDYLGDSDGDGYAHLMEYALGLNPMVKEFSKIIEVERVEGQVVIEIPRNTKVTDADYRIESSPSLQGEQWEVLTEGITILEDSESLLRIGVDQGNQNHHFFRLAVHKLN